MAKINLNSATQKELQTLPGIGASLARKIREYIKANGAFKTIKDLSKVQGVSNTMLKNFSNLIEFKTISKANPAKENYISSAQFKNTANRVKGKIKFASVTAHEPVTIEFSNTNLLDKNNDPISKLKLQRLPHFRENEGSFVNLKVPLSKNTPPGSHKIDILFNGVKHQTEIDVFENIFVSITPNRFFIEAAPGSAIKKQISIRNNGNIPVTFSDPGPVILESDFIECRSIRDVVRKIDKKEASLEQFICLSAEKLEEIYDEGGSMRIRLSEKKPVTIKPGGQAKVELVITLPSKLKRPNRYKGGFRFYNSGISFVVIPTSSTGNIIN